jgi:cation:H+ antiporter
MDSSLAIAVVMVVVGLALLAGGGEGLVRAATTIAELAGVTPAVIGLTVVAMGTSLPELMVSVMSGMRGEADIAVGNVVGSNIFNVAAALGITAIVAPLPVHGAAVKLEWPFMLVASIAVFLLARDGGIDRVEAVGLLVSLALFTLYMIHLARHEVSTAEASTIAAEVESRDIDARRVFVPFVVLAVAIGALMLGGRLLVDGAVTIARLSGLSERVIALTIVAGGTGAPELATSLMAALRGRTDVAIANMIGSNIFNLLGILGLAALIAPLAVAPAIVRTDMLWMIGVAVLLLPVIRSGLRVSRAEGVVLLAAYGVYLVTLFR